MFKAPSTYIKSRDKFKFKKSLRIHLTHKRNSSMKYELYWKPYHFLRSNEFYISITKSIIGQSIIILHTLSTGSGSNAGIVMNDLQVQVQVHRELGY